MGILGFRLFAFSYGIYKDVLTSLIFTGLWFAFTVFSSANPNTFAFLGNALKRSSESIDSGGDLVLNDEYVVMMRNIFMSVARILYKIFTTFSSYGIIFNIDQYKDYQ